MSFVYKYPRPSITADSVIFNSIGDEVFVLLIKRKNDPYKDLWAFPGGFMDMDEVLLSTAERELMEETGLSGITLKELFVADKIDRDPRGRTISIVYFGLINNPYVEICASDDASDVAWFSLTALPELAFDHTEILERVVNIVKRQIKVLSYRRIKLSYRKKL